MNCCRSGFIIVVLGVFVGCDHSKSYSLKTAHVTIESLDQVIPVKDSIVRPIIYHNVHGLGELPVRQKKATFISIVLPAILVAKYHIQERARKLEALLKKQVWNENDSLLFQESCKRYKATQVTEILDKIVLLPNSIVLAQAAMESGWGQSRFFLEANNIFGIWSYNPNEPRLKALRARKNQQVYVRAYENISMSISDYFRTLSIARSYSGLRRVSKRISDPFLLLPHLKNYSEQRMAYINKLERVIRRNSLTDYDKCQIHPDHFEVIE